MKWYSPLLFLLLFISACGTSSQEKKSTLTVQTDAQALQQWVDLSALPEPNNVRWVMGAMGMPDSRLSAPGPTDYYVAAVLEFDAPMDEFVEQLPDSTRRDVYVDADLLENLLPAVVLDAYTQTADGDIIINEAAYAPDVLLKPSLAGGGYLFAVENYIFVYGITT